MISFLFLCGKSNPWQTEIVRQEGQDAPLADAKLPTQCSGEET